MIRNFTGFLAVIVFAGPLFGQSPPGAKPAEPPAKRRRVQMGEPAPSDSIMAGLLSSKQDSVEWDNEPFQVVIDWLHKLAPINVIVRWRVLDVIPVDANTPVTLSMRDATVGTILNEVLSGLGGTEADAEPIQFHTKGNTLVISTRADFRRELIVRTYDVTDLILRIPYNADAPQIDLTQVQAQGAGGGGGQSIFQGGGGAGGGNDPGAQQQGQGGQAYQQELDYLINVIKTTIEPETWATPADGEGANVATGGGRGTIVAYNRNLVVRNTIEVHEQLGGLFK